MAAALIFHEAYVTIARVYAARAHAAGGKKKERERERGREKKGKEKNRESLARIYRSRSRIASGLLQFPGTHMCAVTLCSYR